MPVQKFVHLILLYVDLIIPEVSAFVCVLDWHGVDLRPNKLLSKQSWGWWFETPSHPLWRHRNVKRKSICPSFSASTQRDLTITVGYHNSPGGNGICQFYAGPLTSAETRRFNCSSPISGRFVFIQRTGDAITKALALCEVKVFGNNGEQIFLSMKVQSRVYERNTID